MKTIRHAKRSKAVRIATFKGDHSNTRSLLERCQAAHGCVQVPAEAIIPDSFTFRVIFTIEEDGFLNVQRISVHLPLRNGENGVWIVLYEPATSRVGAAERLQGNVVNHYFGHVPHVIEEQLLRRGMVGHRVFNALFPQPDEDELFSMELEACDEEDRFFPDHQRVLHLEAEYAEETALERLFEGSE